MYHMFFFMKKHGNFNMTEMLDMYPFELELFYHMTVMAWQKEHPKE